MEIQNGFRKFDEKILIMDNKVSFCIDELASRAKKRNPIQWRNLYIEKCPYFMEIPKDLLIVIQLL